MSVVVTSPVVTVAVNPQVHAVQVTAPVGTRGRDGVDATDAPEFQELLARIRGGPLTTATWVKLPAIYKLLLDGTGTVTIATRDADGTVVEAAATYNVTGFRDVYDYYGSVVAVRATLTGTATAEIV